MSVEITAFYAAVLALVVVVLGFQVGTARLRSGVSILEGGDMQLAEKIRRHANFTESVPLALILMAAIEINGAGPGLMHALGLALVTCRILHPIGLRHDRLRHPLRGLGALGTTLVTLVAAGVAVWQFLGS